ncbi:hypothetical protein FVEG_14620 [Fusarium verticillioides 7600]|uniref:Uncharacterized protein n=1 Tax=Gibberella moniliformis (strain M3125 / FGSC 7600) TaxID=334819 RepID=W7LKM3_GIBM7|nr:hypothetical protein FVEG_14620 [Fusarium verticillioides 7600]EWG36105.1 hypothetical protein FVEG_14620 [Fusarium verticillioides 7600]
MAGVESVQIRLTQEIFDKACCNACFIEENGRSTLADYLFHWFAFLVGLQPNDVHWIAEIARDRDYLVRWALERGEKPCKFQTITPPFHAMYGLANTAKVLTSDLQLVAVSFSAECIDPISFECPGYA